MPQGTVKWFNFSKGYGFIEQEEGDDLFVHKTQVTGTIREGDTVDYEVGESDKGPNAINVSKVE
ncbi:MAG: cold shock domain-containing protein [Candidatus Thalassarchaeaceae archaeon]|jgi:CspA family cold shock protein|nr:cold shock domain-containing protein [Candidatus Thalassarchaeaceae archaeon]MDP7003652.1 cold shock domain-containing protein [Candidatus Thalassarchaeaceae archaeon]